MTSLVNLHVPPVMATSTNIKILWQKRKLSSSEKSTNSQMFFCVLWFLRCCVWVSQWPIIFGTLKLFHAFVNILRRRPFMQARNTKLGHISHTTKCVEYQLLDGLEGLLSNSINRHCPMRPLLRGGRRLWYHFMKNYILSFFLCSLNIML
jgi:hypothetical protein